MNVPKLRFKEFTDEWNFIELSKISSDISYGMGLPSKEYDGKNKYIRITDIDDSTNAYSNKNIVSPDGKLEDKYLVNNNDILFARTGASTGKAYLYNEKDGKLYFAGFLIRANIINHNSIFIFQQTKLNKYSKWIKIMSMRSGQPGINSQEYGAYKFSVTSKIEEDKIANFLSLLDKKIELQTKKIEDLKLYKKGLNKTIFKNCNNKYQISDIITEYNERTTINNQYEVLSSTANGIYLQSKYFNKQAASEDNTGYKIVPKNFITYRSMSDTGEFHLNIQNLIDYGIVSPAYPVFNIDENLVNKDYFVYYINENNEFKNRILSRKEGGTRYALSISKFKSIYAFLPSREEQNKLAKLLKNYNNKLEIEILKLYKLEQLKKGLMQKMFA